MSKTPIAVGEFRGNKMGEAKRRKAEIEAFRLFGERIDPTSKNFR